MTDLIVKAGAKLQWSAAEGYLCGPPPMIDAGIEKLVELGIPLRNVFYNKFTDGAVSAAGADVGKRPDARARGSSADSLEQIVHMYITKYSTVCSYNK